MKKLYKIFILLVFLFKNLYSEEIFDEKKLVVEQFEKISNYKNYVDSNFLLGSGIITLIAFIEDENIRKINNNNLKNGNLKKFFYTISDTCDLKSFILPLTTYVTGLTLSDAKLKTVSIISMESGIFSLATTGILKNVLGRARPYNEKGAYNFKFISFNDNYQSFPSGHSTLAWALVTPYAVYYENNWLYLFPVVVSLSRIVKDEHWASDVIGGGIIGFFISYNLAKNLNENIEFNGNSIIFKF